MIDPNDPFYDEDPWGVHYYDSFDYPPRRRHYTSSNETSSKEATELSRDLVEIKKKIKKLQAKEKEIKSTLIKKIPPFHWVDIDGEWIIANERFTQSGKKFNRTKVLYFLKKKFGTNVSKAVASEFRPFKLIYQTIFVKKNNLKKNKDKLNEGDAFYEDNDIHLPDYDIPF